MIGGGKYDDHCGKILAETKAEGVILIVLEGSGGNGISCKCTTEQMSVIPGLLRKVAEMMEKDNAQIKRNIKALGDGYNN